MLKLSKNGPIIFALTPSKRAFRERRTTMRRLGMTLMVAFLAIVILPEVLAVGLMDDNLVIIMAGSVVTGIACMALGMHVLGIICLIPALIMFAAFVLNAAGGAFRTIWAGIGNIRWIFIVVVAVIFVSTFMRRR